MPSVLLGQVRSSLGDRAVEELLRIAGVPYTPEFLGDVGNWIWYEEAVALFEAGAEITGDPRIGLRAGELSLRQHAGTPAIRITSWTAAGPRASATWRRRLLTIEQAICPVWRSGSG